ncbi:3-deoxy-manno-octulosonate cytidylyltransferase [Nonlabens ponticola]|uniref:3-deoxy-manno-octulosonate cytidylyltransferase n=1 Tax=Nonlabens ponticola TaxID=2496866 RepID=A0A3S9MZE1_9FLAO|nr:3-deoxy-manno-octulosonate cytidylyltransferase [Nonlabens ponticola]AZQ44621.1 3-deoxy-manno-octulosonate cytidylyltransferase [Nonlabens ponticola]
MRKIAIIPARLQASRFPEKLLQDLAGKPVIVRTYEATVNTQLFDEVFVVTDSGKIHDVILQHGGNAIMSQKEHECGTDRIAEAAQNIDADIVVNVQGDEPFTNREDLSRLLEIFEKDQDQSIDLTSLMHELIDPADVENPNNVKVIVDQCSNAMYFSRAAIPFQRDEHHIQPVYKHIGIYAFRKKALMDFYHSQPTPLELAEKIEGIRYLEHGKKIRMIKTSQASIGIDTPQDLERAIKLWMKS